MDTKIDTIDFTHDQMRLVFHDGGQCLVPLASFPRLLNATSTQRQHWEIIGNHRGIHWPEVDEDLSIPRLIEDFAAPIAPSIQKTSDRGVNAPL